MGLGVGFQDGFERMQGVYSWLQDAPCAIGTCLAGPEAGQLQGVFDYGGVMRRLLEFHERKTRRPGEPGDSCKGTLAHKSGMPH